MKATEIEIDSIAQKISRAPLSVAYFSYPECSVCRVLRPKVEELVSQLSGVEFLYVDTHQNPQISGQHLIFAVPTIIIFSEGKELRRFSRHFSMGELEEFLDRIVSVKENDNLAR